MKISAWIFIILGLLSLFAALISTINIWVSPVENFENWWMDRKIRNKFWINSIVDFIIAGWLLNRAKTRKIIEK